MGERRDRPSRAPTARELFHKRLADTKEPRNGALGTQAGITGPENLLSEIEGIGFHA
jgi:hypothetical protein